VNLYDGTIEGIRLLDVPAGCVQYHPEAGPGPHDSVGLFDEFLQMFGHDVRQPHQTAVRTTGGGNPRAA
jgi:carbamoyl-phosphate synthase small subunit